MGTQVWRRRKCNKCGHVFTTHEMIDLSHLIVIKKNGEKERYSRFKLYSGIYSAAVSSRPNERREMVGKVVRKIERELLLLSQKEINSKTIGEIALQTLKKTSPGAFLGFLTYHKNIENEQQIRREIKNYLG